MKLVKFAIQTQHHALFLASQSRGNRMQAYGIWNRPQHIACMIKLDNTTFAKLNDALLNMTSPLTRNQRESLVAGTLQLKPKKFHGYTTFKCARQLEALADSIKDLSLQQVIVFPVPISTPHMYFCGSGHAKPATAPFSIFSPNKLVWCSSCRKGFVGANWTCQCNRIW